MEEIERKIRTVYGKDLHDSHMTVRVRIETEGLEHGDKIEIVTRKASTGNRQKDESESREDGDEQETDSDN